MYRYLTKLLQLQLIVFLLISSSGCALKARLIVDTSTPVVEAMNVAFNKNCDIKLLQESLPFALSSISGLIDISPSNEIFLTNGAHAYFGYAFAFVEDTDIERAKKLYLTAMEYGFRAIYKERYKDIISSPLAEFNGHAKKLRKKDVTPLFWATISWLSYIHLNLGDMKVFMEIPKAEILVRRLLELDENFYFGSPHAMMASYYAAQPEITGGNPAKAKEHFEKAIKISEGNFLMHHFFYAKFYAVRTQDKDLYIKLLKQIIDTPEDILANHCAITSLCKIKAKKLLGAVDEYF